MCQDCAKFIFCLFLLNLCCYCAFFSSKLDYNTWKLLVSHRIEKGIALHSSQIDEIPISFFLRVIHDQSQLLIDVVVFWKNNENTCFDDF